MEDLEQYSPLITEAAEYATPLFINIISAIAIFYIGRYISKLTAKLVHRVLVKRKIESTVIGFMENIASAIVMVFTFVAVLAQLGVQTASLVAVVGAAGLAVGLALQGSLANFAAGVLLVIFRPCRAGDFVEVAGVSGSVTEISIFSMTLTTTDNKQLIIPNGTVMNGVIVNYSRLPTRRIDFVIGVSYDADLALAKRVLLQTLAQNGYVLKNPEAVVEVSELADSSINFVVRPWVKTADYWPARFELLAAIKENLTNADIGIPYPQVDVHLPNPAAISA